jgi:thiol-disulfide isomerase/thioredoxin
MKYTLFSLFLLSSSLMGIGCTPSVVAFDTAPGVSLDVIDLVTWETCSGALDDHPCNIITYDQYGETFDLYDLIGQPIVIDLSTMWCGPCASAAAEAEDVMNRYSGDDLIYITVLIEDGQGEVPDIDDLTDWANAYGNVTALVVAGSRSMLESSGGNWAVEGWPTFYYIDRGMITRDIDRGFSPTEIALSIEWLLSL